MTIILSICFTFTMLTMVSLLFAKYSYIKRLEIRQNKKIAFKWLILYKSWLIVGESSQWYRQYLKNSNKLTYAILGCILVSMATLVTIWQTWF